MKKHNLPNVTEVHILGINISALLLNVTTIKSDDSDKANIQIIKKNTQVIDIKIKKWILTTFMSMPIPSLL